MSEFERVFDVMEVFEEKQVKLWPTSLKKGLPFLVGSLASDSKCQGKAPLRTEQQMKQLLMGRFLPLDATFVG